MVLGECPFCHRPFEAELLSKEPVDSSEIARVSDFSGAGGSLLHGRFVSRTSVTLGLTEAEREALSKRPEAFITYKASYKCKHCGKDWTKLHVEAKPIPREYLEDEEEKTEYDAHLEEEEAREEECARK